MLNISTKTPDMRGRSFLSAVTAVVLLLLLPCSSNAQSVLVDDLELTTNLGNYGSPTDIEFSKDGVLWACNKNGILLAAKPDEYDNPRSVLNLESVTCQNGERGLLAVAPHFDFSTDNPYVWVVYNYAKYGTCLEDKDEGPVIRLSRFTCDAGGDLDCNLDSEEVYLETPPFEYDHHNAGDVHFGMDGLLYMTIGDGGNSFAAQDLYNLFGVVVRLSPDNTVPQDNPYYAEGVRCGLSENNGESGDSETPCQEIFAHGLRNPFRFCMNPNKGKTEFYINDVGASIWEEISIGGDGYAGANYGWPMKEGPCTKGSSCGVCGDDGGWQEPEHFYIHDSADEGAVTAGAFVPEGVWPDKYAGKYIYGDFIFGKMYLMDYHGNGDRNSCPATSNYNAVELVDFPDANVVAMSFNPLDNNLYFMSRGFGGRLNRLQFSGTLNRAPQPKIEVSAVSGPVGTTITFDATTSFDPDGDSLSYEWDFDGDGVVDSTLPVDSYTYTKSGSYEVVLKVRDGFGGRPSTTILIGIGEAADAEILVPADGAVFFVGQEFLLTGSASGPGIFNEDTSMTWEVRQHHGTHFHPFLEPSRGNRILLQPAPSPEDFLASTNSYLEVILTVTNDLGIVTTVSRNVLPILRNVTVTSEPPGRVIRVDEFDVTTPATFISWANHPLELTAIDSDFRTWSTLGTDASQMVTLPKDGISDEASTVMFTALFGDAVLPSTPPTPASTGAPTMPPTAAPTSAPTMPPKAAPTSAPTTAPTDAPTMSPTTSAATGKLGSFLMTSSFVIMAIATSL